MAEEAPDDRNVDAGADQLNACGVPERVRARVLSAVLVFQPPQPAHLGELEAHTAGAQGLPVAIGEQRLMIGSRMAFQQRCKQRGGLGPQRTDPLLPALAIELHGRVTDMGV